MWIQRDFVRPAPELIARFASLPASIVSDAMDRLQAMDGQIRALHGKARLCGPAFTIQCVEACNWGAHHALRMAKPGDVLVISNRGATTSSVWGHLMTTAAKRAGIAGVVIDGCIRDAEENRADGFPIFARGAAPGGPHKKWPCHINVPVSCGGVAVLPGDIVLGDADGVVVVPAARAESVLGDAAARAATERDWYRRVEAGQSTVDILGLGPIEEKQ